PRNPYLGLMLPYSPLHHILMRELNFPVVATSGNVSDEPMCIDENEALDCLSEIADVFLFHNRPIVRHVDDSIARVILDRELVLRRARGYAPLPIQIENLKLKTQNCLAVGAHLKNAVALSVGEQVFLSQHIGDLETPQALRAFRAVAKDLPTLYETEPEIIACDLHPEYLSTKFAQSLKGKLAPIQHHYAHIVSCMAENELDEPVLGISWDGTGYGTDGTIWGGEFLLVNRRKPSDTPFHRFAHFRNFPLPGGEAAIKQPRRVALGLLWEIFGDELFERRDLPLLENFSTAEFSMLHRMLAQKINSPLTCSVGRLFDGVAAILGLRQRVNFEGQAAMKLEFAMNDLETDEAYELKWREKVGKASRPPREHVSASSLTSPGSTRAGETPALLLDWQPMILEILHDVQRKLSTPFISAKFHNTLVQVAVAVARESGQQKVVLSGGCFQNKYLTERTIQRLRAEGFLPYWHQRIPPNDGGIAVGQAVAALWQQEKELDANSKFTEFRFSDWETQCC
ncbi:MAG: Sua5/YciO/YrdC/YwlC family protein, partial [Verrucomicrobiota bacterium]